jgi:hypothetical protein
MGCCDKCIIFRDGPCPRHLVWFSVEEGVTRDGGRPSGSASDEAKRNTASSSMRHRPSPRQAALAHPIISDACPEDCGPSD